MEETIARANHQDGIPKEDRSKSKEPFTREWEPGPIYLIKQSHLGHLLIPLRAKILEAL